MIYDRRIWKIKTFIYSASLKKSLKLEHPDSSDLAFLYGTIITDGKDVYSDEITDSICVFADEEVGNCYGEILTFYILSQDESGSL